VVFRLVKLHEMMARRCRKGGSTRDERWKGASCEGKVGPLFMLDGTGRGFR
jgi:hypothetical protein